MKNLTKLKFTVILTLLVMVSIDGWGQASSLTVNGQTLARDGYNAAGVDKSTSTEARDSVTTGSTTRYYVVPDASANSGYTGILTGTLNSGFKWNVNTRLGADTVSINAVPGFGAFTNYKGITWTGTGTLNLTVQEVSAAGCGGDPDTIPISVVAAPTVAYPIAAGVEDTCFKGSTGNLNIQVTKKFYVNYTTPIAGPSAQAIQIRVNITRNNNGTPATVASSLQVNFTRVNSTSGYFEIPAATEFDYFDTYTITLADVSDRISRKGNFWNTATGNTAFTYYVYPVPTTGTIYHLPNM